MWSRCWLRAIGGAASAAALAVLVATLPTASGAAILDPAGPLVGIHVSRVHTLDCQVMYEGIDYSFPGSESDGEFWGWDIPSAANACGTYLRHGGTTYGPNVGGFAHPWNPGNPVPTAFQPVAQSVSGDGSEASPWTITTTVQAGAGVTLTQVDSYVSGLAEIATTMHVANSGPARDFILYRAGDCYLPAGVGDPDSGYGLLDLSGPSVGCTTSPSATAGRAIVWTATQGDARAEQNRWDLVWRRPGFGQPMGNTCLCAVREDNGAGLSWQFHLATGESATTAMRLSFVVPPPPKRTVLPEPALPYPEEAAPPGPLGGNALPEPRAQTVPGPCGDLVVHFDGTGSHDADGAIVQWLWEFGDGQAAEGAMVRHVYAHAGPQEATLTVRDDGGASASRAIRVSIPACPPPGAQWGAQAPATPAGGAAPAHRDPAHSSADAPAVDGPAVVPSADSRPGPAAYDDELAKESPDAHEQPPAGVQASRPSPATQAVAPGLLLAAGTAALAAAGAWVALRRPAPQAVTTCTPSGPAT